MKKQIITIALIISTISFASAAVVDDAISRMYVNGLTIHDNTTDFDADRGLRRDEAAKFYVNFAKLLGKTSYVKTASQCVFSDINSSRSDLKDIVIESCRLGLFQGNKGKFNPKSQLTNAQAITVLVRLLAGNQSEVGLSHWADNYYNKANELNVLSNVSMNSKNSIATRGNVGVIIYNGSNTNEDNTSEDNTSEDKTVINCGTSSMNVPFTSFATAIEFGREAEISDEVLLCLGKAISNNCQNAKGTFQYMKIPSPSLDVYEIINKNNKCYFKLSISNNQGLYLASQGLNNLSNKYIMCPIDSVKVIDNEGNISQIPKLDVINKPQEYAAIAYLYGYGYVFLENEFDQTKINDIGCYGDWIGHLISTLENARTKAQKQEAKTTVLYADMLAEE